MSDCLLWEGGISTNGYGTVRVDGVTKYAHRVAYELHVGPIPNGHQVDHLCRVRACVNPAHLEAVTQQENIRRQLAAYQVHDPATHCRAGHRRTGDNNRIDRRGRRVCRPCMRQFQRDYRARLRQRAAEVAS